MTDQHYLPLDCSHDYCVARRRCGRQHRETQVESEGQVRQLPNDQPSPASSDQHASSSADPQEVRMDDLLRAQRCDAHRLDRAICPTSVPFILGHQSALTS